MKYIKQRYGSPDAAWAQYFQHVAGRARVRQGRPGPRVRVRGERRRAGAAVPEGVAPARRPVRPRHRPADPEPADPRDGRRGRARQDAGQSRGLSPGQHRFWANAATSESRLLATLHKELTTEKAWRGQLGLNELGLDKEIRAAGNLPGLAGPVRGWKAQEGRDKATIAGISKMIGNTTVAAAAATAHPAPPPGSGPVVFSLAAGPVAGGPSLATLAGEFSFDRGGTLAPGWNPPLYNGTGRPETLIPASSGGGRGGGDIHVHLHNAGVIGSRAEVDTWLNESVDRLARNGRLAYAFKRSASAA